MSLFILPKLSYSAKLTAWGYLDKNLLLELAQLDFRLIIATVHVIWNIFPSTNSPLYRNQPTANLLILQDNFRMRISLDSKKSTDISVPRYPLRADHCL